MARVATRRWIDKTRMISGMAVLVYCVPHRVVIVTTNRKADVLLGNVIGLMNSSVSILSPLELFGVRACLFVCFSARLRLSEKAKQLFHHSLQHCWLSHVNFIVVI